MSWPCDQREEPAPQSSVCSVLCAIIFVQCCVLCPVCYEVCAVCLLCAGYVLCAVCCIQVMAPVNPILLPGYSCNQDSASSHEPGHIIFKRIINYLNRIAVKEISILPLKQCRCIGQEGGTPTS